MIKFIEIPPECQTHALTFFLAVPHYRRNIVIDPNQDGLSWS